MPFDGLWSSGHYIALASLIAFTLFAVMGAIGLVMIGIEFVIGLVRQR